MQNRELASNTFEGGLDLDTDSRLVKNNKLRESLNVDITKRGDSFVVTDIKGETIMFEFEDYSGKEVYLLASKFVNFLVEPTGVSRRAALVFYVTSEYKFIIKILYVDDSSEGILLEEDLTEEEYLLLKDSTVDLDVIGKFGYDVVYFVDNRRQPRKLDCVTYLTNSNVMTLSLNSLSDEDGYKRVGLHLNSSSVPEDSHRCYVYAYKTGGSLFYDPVNPLTETVKYVDVNFSGSVDMFFNIYPEDYADYTFQIVYHKEGGVVYRNFIIGDPFQVQLSIGEISSNFIIALESITLDPGLTQLNSWNFLYSGHSFPAFMSTPTVEVGVTILYLTETEDIGSLVSDGYYQRADLPNTYFLVEDGVIIEQEINNGNVVWSCVPDAIEEDVRSASALITEGNRDRLTGITIDVPSSIIVGGITYNFIKTEANTTPGREKSSMSNNFTYTLEYPEDLTPFSYYSPDEVVLQVFLIGISFTGSGYDVRVRATVSSAITEEILVDTRVRAIDVESGTLVSPADVSVTIPAGETSFDHTQFYDGNGSNETSFGPICVIDYVYTGSEIINNPDSCS